MDAHAVGVNSAPAPSAPDVAVGVAANAVREPRLEIGKDFRAAQRCAVVHDIEHDDVGGVLRPIGGTGVHDVELLEIGRKAEAVRAPHRALGPDRRLAARIETIDAGGQLELGLVSLVGAEDPVARVGEPDRAVGVDGRVIGRVELLALEGVDQDGPGAVVLAAPHSPGVVFHRDQPALVVARMPVRISGLGLVHADVAVVLAPPERAVVRDVAPDQAAPVAHPDRALAPERAVVAHAVPDALQRRVALDSGEALVTDLPRGLRVGDRGLAGPVAVAAATVRKLRRLIAMSCLPWFRVTRKRVTRPLASDVANPIRGGARTQIPKSMARPLYCKRASAGTLSFSALVSRWEAPMGKAARGGLVVLLLCVGLQGCAEYAPPVTTVQQECERSGGAWRST